MTELGCQPAELSVSQELLMTEAVAVSVHHNGLQLQDTDTLIMFLQLNSCESYIIWRLVPDLFSNLVKRSICCLKKYIFPHGLLYVVHVNAYS